MIWKTILLVIVVLILVILIGSGSYFFFTVFLELNPIVRIIVNFILGNILGYSASWFWSTYIKE